MWQVTKPAWHQVYINVILLFLFCIHNTIWKGKHSSQDTAVCYSEPKEQDRTQQTPCHLGNNIMKCWTSWLKVLQNSKHSSFSGFLCLKKKKDFLFLQCKSSNNKTAIICTKWVLILWGKWTLQLFFLTWIFLHGTLLNGEYDKHQRNK